MRLQGIAPFVQAEINSQSVSHKEDIRAHTVRCEREVFPSPPPLRRRHRRRRSID